MTGVTFMWSHPLHGRSGWIRRLEAGLVHHWFVSPAKPKGPKPRPRPRPRPGY